MSAASSIRLRASNNSALPSPFPCCPKKLLRFQYPFDPLPPVVSGTFFPAAGAFRVPADFLFDLHSAGQHYAIVVRIGNTGALIGPANAH